MSQKQSETTKSTNKSTSSERPWPYLLRITPRAFLLAMAAWLLFAWGAFLTIDIFGIFDPGFNRPVWQMLFNDRPVEWTQWFLLAFAAAMAGYLSGRLDGMDERMSARFFLLLSIGFGLMLIEDAGDIRHVMTRELGRVVDSRVLGVPYRFVFELPYFTALAAVPVYAVARYGRYAWRSVKARGYLVGGVILYAIASMGSVASNIGNLYGVVGAWIDTHIFAGRFPSGPYQSEGWSHFYLLDSVIEESVEVLAMTLLVAAILAFTQDLRQRRLLPIKAPTKKKVSSS